MSETGSPDDETENPWVADTRAIIGRVAVMVAPVVAGLVFPMRRFARLRRQMALRPGSTSWHSS